MAITVQKLNVTMDVDDTISIQENDDSRMISRQKSSDENIGGNLL